MEPSNTLTQTPDASRTPCEPNARGGVLLIFLLANLEFPVGLTGMPSKPRIQFEGARYHVINRGNYRGDIFSSEGASESFLRTLAEAAQNYGWKIHAYVIMRNHYHLAIETPKANLSTGMHWLQATFASRFNRFRKVNGRLFQGPYKALLLENMEMLCRVVDYIHLNPVRARVLAPAHVGTFRWSSLNVLRKKGKRPAWLEAHEWLEARGGWHDTPEGIAAYEEYLAALGNDDAAQKQAGLEKLSTGWALGTPAWKQALAREYAQRARLFGMGLEKDELVEIRQAENENALAQALKAAGRQEQDLQTRPRAQAWKIKMALELRGSGVPVNWLARRLHLGKATSVRSLLSRSRRNKDHEKTP